MKHLWKILVVIGSVGFAYSVMQFKGGTVGFPASSNYNTFDFSGNGSPGESSTSAHIPYPFDICGAISFGLVVTGFVVRKKS